MRFQSRKLFIISLFFFSSLSFAQLGLSEKEIISKQGNYFKREIENSVITLIYRGSIKNDFDKDNIEIVSYQIDMNSGKCFYIVYATPKSAINRYINLLNNIAIKKDENSWTDYKNNSIYVLSVDEKFVGIKHYYLANANRNVDELAMNDFKEKYNECEKINQTAFQQISFLRKTNEDLLNSMSNLTKVCGEGSNNLERALKLLKEKDEKIAKLMMLTKEKDSIINIYTKDFKAGKKR